MSHDLQEKIIAVNQKTKELNALYHSAALRAGIPDAELCVWSVLLCSDEEYSQRDLALLLSLPPQTVNTIVSNMVKKGYISLDHCPGTRNRKVVRTTEAGRTYAEKNVRWIFDAEQKAVGQTDPADVDRLIELMGTYISSLKEELGFAE